MKQKLRQLLEKLLPPEFDAINGIQISSGVVEPCLQNSFAKEVTQNFAQRNFHYVLLGLISLLQLSWLFFNIAYDRTADLTGVESITAFGELRPRRVATVIEIDEIFGNQFVKKKEPKIVTVTGNQQGIDGTLDGEGVTDIGFGDESAPRPLRAFRNVFPSIARTHGVEADATLEVVIDKMGIVRQVYIVGVVLRKTVPEPLATDLKNAYKQAARSALMGHPFQPKSLNGQPANVRFPVPMPFDLIN